MSHSVVTAHVLAAGVTLEPFALRASLAQVSADGGDGLVSASDGACLLAVVLQSVKSLEHQGIYLRCHRKFSKHGAVRRLDQNFGNGLAVRISPEPVIGVAARIIGDLDIPVLSLIASSFKREVGHHGRQEGRVHVVAAISA